MRHEDELPNQQDKTDLKRPEKKFLQKRKNVPRFSSFSSEPKIPDWKRSFRTIIQTRKKLFPKYDRSTTDQFNKAFKKKKFTSAPESNTLEDR